MKPITRWLTLGLMGTMALFAGCGPLLVINSDEPVGGRPSSQPPSLYSPSIAIQGVDEYGALTLRSSVGVRSKTRIASVQFEVTAPDGRVIRVLAALTGRELYSATYPLPRSFGGSFRVVAIATNTEGQSAQIELPELVQVPPGPPGSLL